MCATLRSTLNVHMSKHFGTFVMPMISLGPVNTRIKRYHIKGIGWPLILTLSFFTKKRKK